MPGSERISGQNPNSAASDEDAHKELQPKNHQAEEHGPTKMPFLTQNAIGESESGVSSSMNVSSPVLTNVSNSQSLTSSNTLTRTKTVNRRKLHCPNKVEKAFHFLGGKLTQKEIFYIFKQD